MFTFLKRLFGYEDLHGANEPKVEKLPSGRVIKVEVGSMTNEDTKKIIEELSAEYNKKPFEKKPSPKKRAKSENVVNPS